ncbi:MAG: hypothetical protein ACOZQL_33020 [Myxococcota bacterium]
MRLRKDQVVAELRLATKGGTLAGWHGIRALSSIREGVDPALVRRAIEKVFEVGFSLVPDCGRLPDEYVPTLLEVVAQRSPADHVFLGAWLTDGPPGPQVREAATWLRALRLLDSRQPAKKRLATLTKLVANGRALEASQAVIAAGVEEGRMLALLAFDGSESSADVLMPVVLRAVKAKDRSLDRLVEWLVPHARGPLMAPVVTTLQEAMDAREGRGPLGWLLRHVGAPEHRAHLEVTLESRERVAVSPRASAWLVLQSRQLPHVAVSIARHRTASPHFDSWRIEDGEVRLERALSLEPFTALHELPAWLAAVAAQLGVTWDFERARVKSSLRGKARAAAVAWLEAPPPA